MRKKLRELITSIRAPRYMVNHKGDVVSVNEYELRRLAADIAIGEIPFGSFTVRDEKGTTATIQEDGTFDRSLYGMDLNSQCTFAIIRERREKERRVNEYN